MSRWFPAGDSGTVSVSPTARPPSYVMADGHGYGLVRTAEQPGGFVASIGRGRINYLYQRGAPANAFPPSLAETGAAARAREAELAAWAARQQAEQARQSSPEYRMALARQQLSDAGRAIPDSAIDKGLLRKIVRARTTFEMATALRPFVTERPDGSLGFRRQACKTVQKAWAEGQLPRDLQRFAEAVSAGVWQPLEVGKHPPRLLSALGIERPRQRPIGFASFSPRQRADFAELKQAAKRLVKQYSHVAGVISVGEPTGGGLAYNRTLLVLFKSSAPMEQGYLRQFRQELLATAKLSFGVGVHFEVEKDFYEKTSTIDEKRWAAVGRGVRLA